MRGQLFGEKMQFGKFLSHRFRAIIATQIVHAHAEFETRLAKFSALFLLCPLSIRSKRCYQRMTLLRVKHLLCFALGIWLFPFVRHENMPSIEKF